MSSVTFLSLFLNAVRSTVTTMLAVIRKTQFNRSLFLTGIGAWTAYAIIVLVAIFGVTLFKELTGWGLSPLEKRRLSKTRRSIMDRVDHVALILSFASATIATFQGLFGTTFSLVGLMWSTILTWIPPLFILLVGSLFMAYSVQILNVVAVFYQGLLSPINSILMAAVSLFSMGFYIVYPIIVGIWKFIKSLPYRILQVIVICIFDVLYELIALAMLTVYSFVTALILWVFSGPLTTELPLVDTFSNLGQLIALSTTKLIECSCHILRYITGGITRAFQNISFALMATSLVNFVWTFLSYVLILPTLSLFTIVVTNTFVWPDFEHPYRNWIGTLDNAGLFLQNATVFGFDIWIVGGNGTIVDMVTGEQAMPTDGLQYLIRFLQSAWAQAILRGLDLIFVMPIWQAAYWLQHVPNMSQLDGNVAAWNVEWIYSEADFTINGLGTIIETIGMCDVNNPNYPPVQFSQLVSVLSAALNLARVVWDCLFGEIYYLRMDITKYGILVFTGQYIETSPVYAAYKQDVIWLGEAYGCLLAYVSTYFGVSFQGVAEVVLYWLMFIPAQLITKLRIIFTGADPIILDQIQVGPMEASMLKIAEIGGIFWQFQPGASEEFCRTQVTFLCAAGLSVMGVIIVLDRLFVTIVALFIKIIQFVGGSIVNNAIQTLQIPKDIACDPTLTVAGNPNVPGASCQIPIVLDIYDTGCRVGVAIATIIPFNLPCISETPNACWVTQFPNYGQNTFTTCFGTLGCRVGRWAGILPDFFLSVFNWITNFTWNANTDGSSQDDNFLVNIFKKILYLITFELASPLCPLGHFLDCIWSLLLKNGGGNTGDGPATALLCLISAFLVVLQRDLGDLIIILIRIVIFFLSLIFGVPALGSLSELGDLISQFFVVFGTVIKQVGLMILSFILSALFTFLKGACDVINSIIGFFGGTAIDCSQLDVAQNIIFNGLQIESIFAPANINYKRDLGVDVAEAQSKKTRDQNTRAAGATTAAAVGFNCTAFFRSPEYESYFYDSVLKREPAGLAEFCFDSPLPAKASPAEVPVSVLDIVTEPQPPAPSGSFEVLKRQQPKKNEDSPAQTLEQRGLFSRFSRSVYVDPSTTGAMPLLRVHQEIILEHFGPGPEDTEDAPAYMATQVYWATDSDCRKFFQDAKSYKLHQLGPADKNVMEKCIRQKFEALNLQRTGALFVWVPEDIFYNTWNASVAIFFKLVRILLVAAQFFWDKQNPPERLMTQSYQRLWQSFKIDTDFYNTTLRPIILAAPTTAQGYKEAGWVIGNMTFDQYVKRNFPVLFPSANGSFTVQSGDRVTDPFKAFGELTYQFSMSVIDTGTITQKVVEAFRNQTYSFYLNYTDGVQQSDQWKQQPSRIGYQGVYYDARNRTHLLNALGPDVLRAVDSLRTTQGLYGLFSHFVSVVERSTSILNEKNVTVLSQIFQRMLGGGAVAVDPGVPSSTQQAVKRNSDHVAWQDFYPDLYKSKEGQKPQAESIKGGEGFDDKPEAFQRSLFESSTFLFAETPKVFSAAYNNYSWIMDNLRKGMEERLTSLYQSPAFEKELTPLGSIVATFASGLHKNVLGGKEPANVLSPWCVAKAARVHNVTFAEIRQMVRQRDCKFYESIEFLRGGNYTYSDFTKEFYRMDKNGQFVPIKALPNETAEKTFFEKYMPALNAEAQLVRNIPSMFYNAITSELWAYGYLMFGSSGTNGQGSDNAFDRAVEIILGVHPSFDEYKQGHDYYGEMKKLLPKNVRERIEKSGHIRFDDKAVWDAWKKVPGAFILDDYLKRVRVPSMIKEAFIQERLNAENRQGFFKHDAAKHQAIRAELLKTDEFKVVRNVKELLKRAFEKQEAEMRMRMQSFIQPDSTYYNRFTLLQVADPPDNPIVDILDNFGLNLTQFFTKHCYTDQLWLCEECYIVDAVLGRTIDVFNYMNYFYSNQLPDIMTGEMATYQYFVGQTMQNLTNPRALVGKYKTSQPWVPILGEPVGVVLQFSDSEIADGLDWFAWLWQILGAKLPDLIQNGTCQVMMNDYNFQESAGTSPTNNIGWEILRILYYDFGIPVCSIWDTIVYLVENSIPNIGSYVVEHYILCNWTTAIDGSARIYSLSAGITILGTYLVGLTVLFLLLAVIFGPVVIVPIGALWASYWIFMLVSIYNWSFGCFPIPPNTLVDDAINLWAYTPTLGGPCSILLGAFINDTNYNANTCTNMSRFWSMSSGADLGFTNPLNVIEFAKVAYGIDWGILQFIREVYAFISGGAGPTFDYSDYNTNPIRHRNYTAWFFVAVPTFGSLGFVVAFLACLLVLSFMMNALPLATSLLMSLFGLVKFLEKLGRVKY